MKKGFEKVVITNENIFKNDVFALGKIFIEFISE